MNLETENGIPSVVMTERAAQVFKDACEAEGKSLDQSFLRIGAHPGGCSGWKYDLESAEPEDVGPEDVKILTQDVSVVVERKTLTDIIGPIRIDFSDTNLVEQGFIFEQLFNGHQCGCGESFTPVKDLKQNKKNAPIS